MGTKHPRACTPRARIVGTGGCPPRIEVSRIGSHGSGTWAGFGRLFAGITASAPYGLGVGRRRASGARVDSRVRGKRPTTHNVASSALGLAEVSVVATVGADALRVVTPRTRWSRRTRAGQTDRTGGFSDERGKHQPGDAMRRDASRVSSSPPPRPQSRARRPRPAGRRCLVASPRCVRPVRASCPRTRDGRSGSSARGGPRPGRTAPSGR